MKKSTRTTTPAKKITKKTVADVAIIDPNPVTFRDFTSSLLIVSLLINLFILVGWLIMQVTTRYDLQVAALLFVR